MHRPMRVRRAACALLSLAAAGLQVACSDSRVVEVNPGLSCGSRLSVCDIHSAACRQDVLDVVACLRGYDSQVQQPSAVFIELDDLIGGTEVPDDSPAVRDARDTRLGYALFGLVAADEVSAEEALEAQADSIAALYSPAERRVFILENPGGDQISEAELGMPVDVYRMSVLAHEYVHFLQDRETDLGAFSEQLSELFDPAMAGISAVEGEAVLYEAFFGLQLAGRRISREPVLREFEAYVDFAEEAIREAGSPVLEARYLFPYSYGAHSAAVLHFDGSPEDVEGLRLSHSTLEYIQRRWAEPERRPTPEPLDTNVPQALSAIHTDRLGPWLLAAFVSRVLGLSSEEALAFASQWRVDRMRVFRSEDEEIVAQWLLEFGVPSSADAAPATRETPLRLREWASALQAAAPVTAPTWSVAAAGNRLEIIASTHPSSVVAQALAENSDTWGDAGAPDDASDSDAFPPSGEEGSSASALEEHGDGGSASGTRFALAAPPYAGARSEWAPPRERSLEPRILARREKVRARLLERLVSR